MCFLDQCPGLPRNPRPFSGGWAPPVQPCPLALQLTCPADPWLLSLWLLPCALLAHLESSAVLQPAIHHGLYNVLRTHYLCEIAGMVFTWMVSKSRSPNPHWRASFGKSPRAHNVATLSGVMRIAVVSTALQNWSLMRTLSICKPRCMRSPPGDEPKHSMRCTALDTANACHSRLLSSNSIPTWSTAQCVKFTPYI